MSLFTAPRLVVCTEEEWTVLHRPIINGGGLQLLLKRVLAGTVKAVFTALADAEDEQRERERGSVTICHCQSCGYPVQHHASCAIAKA